MPNSSNRVINKKCVGIFLGSIVGVSLVYSLVALFKDAYFSDINDCSTLDRLGCIAKALNNTQAVSCTDSTNDDVIEFDSSRYCSDAQIVRYNNLAQDLSLRNQSHGISLVSSGFVLMGLIYCLMKAEGNNGSLVSTPRYSNVGDIGVPANFGSASSGSARFSQNNTPSAPPVATMLHNNQQSQTGYAPTLASLPV